MEEKEIKITLKRYSDLKQLPEEEQELILQARMAGAKAYSPYSKFSVGAAVLLENGEIISGSNQENASFPAGSCAERVVLSFANAKWPEVAVKAIVVTAVNDKGEFVENVRPCGICRQIMLEVERRFEKPIKVIMDGQKGIEVIEEANFLLPLSFGL